MISGPLIGVIGAAHADPPLFACARELGRLIAERGGIVVCGGMSGVMEAVCRGAKEAGGLTIGIVPGERASDANAYVDIPIVTGLSHARNVIIVRTAEVVIAVGGGYGTLSEIAIALKLGRPVLALESWALDLPIEYVTTPAEAVEGAWRHVVLRGSEVSR